MAEFDEYIKTTLAAKGIRYKNGGQRLFIPCPYHHETEPSCIINVKASKYELGSFKCFGCGKRGSWADLAKRFGVVFTEESYDPGDPFLNLNSTLKDLLTVDYKIPLGCKPWSETWRKMPLDFLDQFSPSKWYDDMDEVYRILFPVVINDDTIGHIGAYLPKDKAKVSVRYRDSAGAGWKMKALFPYNMIETNYVVLVEGPYDALRLIYNGISAMAILGTNNWGINKINLLVAKGFDKIFILMDGDDAGYKANRNVYKSLKPVFGKEALDMIDLPDGVDPGDMPMSLVKNLAKYIVANGGVL